MFVYKITYKLYDLNKHFQEFFAEIYTSTGDIFLLYYL